MTVPRLKQLVAMAVFATVTSPSGVYADSGFHINNAALTTGITRKNAYSADDHGSDTTAVVHVVRQSLRELLMQVARRDGYEATVSNQVKGLVQDQRFPLEIHSFMPRLAELYGLMWHAQEKRLFISAATERAGKSINLGEVNPTELNNALRESGIHIGNQKITQVPGQNQVFVSGAANFIEKMELLASELISELSEQPDKKTHTGTKP